MPVKYEMEVVLETKEKQNSTFQYSMKTQSDGIKKNY